VVLKRSFTLLHHFKNLCSKYSLYYEILLFSLGDYLIVSVIWDYTSFSNAKNSIPFTMTLTDLINDLLPVYGMIPYDLMFLNFVNVEIYIGCTMMLTVLSG
jgi:hypothetical protein